MNEFCPENDGHEDTCKVLYFGTLKRMMPNDDFNTGCRQIWNYEAIYFNTFNPFHAVLDISRFKYWS